MFILYINSFCQEMSPILQIIGQLLNLFKIFLPIILIILGVFDIGKAIVSSKSSDVKTNMKNFFKKVALCIFVFFIPTIGMIIFGFVGGFNDIIKESGIDFEVCYDCLYKPDNDTCSNAVKIMEKKK